MVPTLRNSIPTRQRNLTRDSKEKLGAQLQVLPSRKLVLDLGNTTVANGSTIIIAFVGLDIDTSYLGLLLPLVAQLGRNRTIENNADLFGVHKVRLIPARRRRRALHPKQPLVFLDQNAI